MPEKVVTVASVRAHETRSGNTRYVITDADGAEYTTFRDAVVGQAREAEGRKARLTYHEAKRGPYENVYLDAVDLVPDDSEVSSGPEVDEVAWKTAVDAAPWLLGAEPTEAVPDDELFEALQPFKQRVAADIREGGDPPPERDSSPARG